MTVTERGRLHALVDVLHISPRVLVSGFVVEVEPTAVWVVPVHDRPDRAGADDLVISEVVSPFGCELVVMPTLRCFLPPTALEPDWRALPSRIAAVLIARARSGGKCMRAAADAGAKPPVRARAASRSLRLPAELRAGCGRPGDAALSAATGADPLRGRDRRRGRSSALPAQDAGVASRGGSGASQPWRTRLAARWQRWRMEAWAARVHAEAGRLSQAGLGGDVPDRMRSVVILLVGLPEGVAEVWRPPRLDPDRAANAADLRRVALCRQRRVADETAPPGGEAIHQAVRRLLMRLPPLAAAEQALLHGDAGDLLELIARLIHRASPGAG